MHWGCRAACVVVCMCTSSYRFCVCECACKGCVCQPVHPFGCASGGVRVCVHTGVCACICTCALVLCPMGAAMFARVKLLVCAHVCVLCVSVPGCTAPCVCARLAPGSRS